MNYKRGKRPARPGSIQMLFGAYFNADKLPLPPLVFGRPWLVSALGILGNDRFGDCVWAGAAHETLMLEADANQLMAVFTSNNVLSDYSAATGFVQSDPATDQGTDVQAAAKYRQQTGIVDLNGRRHQIDVYAALRTGDLEQLALAVSILGIAGVGVSLPDNAESQFNMGEAWDVQDNAPGSDGHYIPCIGRNSRGNYLFVSWGRLQAATPRWVATYMDEGICYLSRERLKSSGLSPQGFNMAALEEDFRNLTGGT